MLPYIFDQQINYFIFIVNKQYLPSDSTLTSCQKLYLLIILMGNHCCHSTPQQSEIIAPLSIKYIQEDNNNLYPEKKTGFIQQQLTSNNNEQLFPPHQPHQGTITLPDGSHYEGLINNGVPHGKGKQTHEIGDKYTGFFYEGQKQGHGLYQFNNGIIYEGEFKHGDISGKGKMTWPNGDWYDGQFQNNLMHGFGKYFSKETKSYYEGTYSKGNRHGRGKIVCNNNVLEGNWQNGQFVFKKQIQFSS